MNQSIIDNIKSTLDNGKLPYNWDNIKTEFEKNYILPYGYKWFNGAVFSNLHTDLYNKNCVQIVFNSINRSNLDYTENIKNENHYLIVFNNPENLKKVLSRQNDSKKMNNKKYNFLD